MQVLINESGHKFYDTPVGLFPSVTSILNATMPSDQRERLDKWREATRNDSNSENPRLGATERGKTIHKLIETKLKGEKVECPLELTDYWNQALRIFKVIGDVIAIEEQTYHSELQYAGTLDLIAYWHDRLTLFDFKTSHREKRAQYLTDPKIQIAAYRGAYQQLYNTEISQGLIVVITPLTVQFFSLEKEELETYWQEWLSRLESYQNILPEKGLLKEF